jgi:hypothetical protein
VGAVGAAQLERKALAERYVDVAVELLVVVVAVTQPDARAEFFGVGTSARDVDHARDRVAAEQRALRSAQDLHAGDVERLDHRARVHADEHFVDDHAGRRVETLLDVGGADSADGDGRGAARPLLQVVDDDVRRRVGHRLQVDVEAARDLLGAERAHGRGDVLQVFLALARRDDDLLEAATGRRGLLRHSHRRCGRRAAERHRHGRRETRTPVRDVH